MRGHFTVWLVLSSVWLLRSAEHEGAARARVGGKGSAMAKVTEVTTTSAAFMDAVKKGVDFVATNAKVSWGMRARRRTCGRSTEAHRCPHCPSTPSSLLSASERRSDAAARVLPPARTNKQTAFHYGFVPFVVIWGMTTEPRTSFAQLIGAA